MTDVAIFDNHGRWVAQCPVCQSSGVMILDAAWFECWDPDHRANVGAPATTGVHGLFDQPIDQDDADSRAATNAPIYTVTWPVVAADIGIVLDARPDPYTRNWIPGETILDLIAENDANGVPVDNDVRQRAGG